MLPHPGVGEAARALLGEEQLDEVWNDSGAEDANGRWAEYRDGKIGVKAMAQWLYRSRTHKKDKASKLKSAYGAISQQQNTSKLISGKQADALRNEMKRLYEGVDSGMLEKIAGQLQPVDGYLAMEFFTSGEKAQLLGMVDGGMLSRKAFQKMVPSLNDKLREVRKELQAEYGSTHKTWKEISAAEKAK